MFECVNIAIIFIAGIVVKLDKGTAREYNNNGSE